MKARKTTIGSILRDRVIAARRIAADTDNACKRVCGATQPNPTNPSCLSCERASTEGLGHLHV